MGCLFYPLLVLLSATLAALLLAAVARYDMHLSREAIRAGALGVAGFLIRGGGVGRAVQARMTGSIDCVPRHMPVASRTLNHLGGRGRNIMLARAKGTFQTAWPTAAIGLAVAINGVWIAAIGYGISKLF
jgi:hypothetical protein